MTASEQYLHEMDTAMRELYGVPVKPRTPCGQEAERHKAIRLPGGCLLYRLPWRDDSAGKEAA